MFMAIAVALLAIAVWVFVRGIHDLVVIPHGEPFAVTIIRAVNSALFIVVVLELIRTIVARLEGGSFQLQPFLVIGINVGGVQTLEHDQQPQGGAVVLLRRLEATAEHPACPSWPRQRSAAHDHKLSVVGQEAVKSRGTSGLLHHWDAAGPGCPGRR